MKKEQMTMKQLIFAIVLFIFGNSAMIGFNTSVAQDTWIAFLMAMVPTVLIVLVYARIMNLYPRKNLFDIMQEVFKPVIGKILIVLMISYALYVGSLVLCTFSDFIRMSSLNLTPELVVIFTFMLAAYYVAVSKIDTFAKGSVLILYILFITVLITILMSVSHFNKGAHLYPVADHSIKALAGSSWMIFAKPFAEVVLFLGLADTVIRNKSDNPYKVFIYAILIGAAILLATHLRNLMIMGPNLLENSFFPSHRASRVVGIKNVLERIEGLITYNFMIAGIAKITVVLIFSAKGTAKLFGLNDYKSLLLPISLILAALCVISADSIVEIFDFLKVYKYYALPFQVIIPLIVWIGAEIKLRTGKRKENDTQSQA